MKKFFKNVIEIDKRFKNIFFNDIDDIGYSEKFNKELFVKEFETFEKLIEKEFNVNIVYLWTIFKKNENIQDIMILVIENITTKMKVEIPYNIIEKRKI